MAAGRGCGRVSNLQPTSERESNDRNVQKAMYPRTGFHLLVFPDEVTCLEKLKWANSYTNRNDFVHKLAIPHKNKIWFRKMYVRRNEKQLIAELQAGKYGGIKFISEDKPPVRKYLVKGYPKDMELDHLHHLFGEELLDSIQTERYLYRGHPTTTVNLTWKSLDKLPPIQTPLIRDFPDSPVITIEDAGRGVVCFKCQKTGHMKDRCVSDPACPKCGLKHEMQNCDTDVTDPNNIKCPLCHSRGVNVWTCGCKKVTELISEQRTKWTAREEVINDRDNLNDVRDELIGTINSIATDNEEKTSCIIDTLNSKFAEICSMYDQIVEEQRSTVKRLEDKIDLLLKERPGYDVSDVNDEGQDAGDGPDTSQEGQTDNVEENEDEDEETKEVEAENGEEKAEEIENKEEKKEDNRVDEELDSGETAQCNIILCETAIEEGKEIIVTPMTKPAELRPTRLCKGASNNNNCKQF